MDYIIGYTIVYTIVYAIKRNIGAVFPLPVVEFFTWLFCATFGIPSRRSSPVEALDPFFATMKICLR